MVERMLCKHKAIGSSPIISKVDMVFTFKGHWQELWIRSLLVLCNWIVLSVLFFKHRCFIWDSLVVLHTTSQTSKEFHLISTDIGEALTCYLTLSIYLGFSRSLPLLCYHRWAFLSPGLLARESKVLGKTLVFSSRVIYRSYVFSVFVFGPGVYRFLLRFSSGLADPEFMGKRNSFLSFLMSIWMWNSLMFLIPLGLYWLLRRGVVNTKQLGSAFGRKLYLLISLCVGAMRSPPDVTSQLLIAVPLVLGYELSILCSYYHQELKKVKSNGNTSTTSKETSTTID